MNLTAIRQAIADELTSIDGVRVEARHPDLVNVPAGGLVVVDAGDPWVEYLGAMSGGHAELRFTLLVIAGRISERSAQLRLEELLSAGLGETRSVYDALKPGDLPQRLGGEVHDLVLTTASAPRALSVGEVTFLTAELEVRVMVDRRHN